MTLEILLLLMVLPPLVGAALNGIFGPPLFASHGLLDRLRRVGPLHGFRASLRVGLLALPGQPEPTSTPTSPGFKPANLRADYALFYDRLTLIMTLTVTVVAFLIHLYSRGYMEHEGGYYRFFTYLNLFLFMMLTLVTAASYPLMFVGWEGVGLCSYLLIGFYFTKKSASDAGKKAFIVTRIGDAGFTVGVALLFWTFHSLDFQTVFAARRRTCLGESESVADGHRAAALLGRGGQIRTASACMSGCPTPWKAPHP